MSYFRARFQQSSDGEDIFAYWPVSSQSDDTEPRAHQIEYISFPGEMGMTEQDVEDYLN